MVVFPRSEDSGNPPTVARDRDSAAHQAPVWDSTTPVTWLSGPIKWWVEPQAGGSKRLCFDGPAYGVRTCAAVVATPEAMQLTLPLTELHGALGEMIYIRIR